jgi:hypothetical protein
MVKLVLNLLFLSFEYIQKINSRWHVSCSPRAWNPKPLGSEKGSKNRGIGVTLKSWEKLFAFCTVKLSLPLVYLTARWLRISSALSAFIWVVLSSFATSSPRAYQPGEPKEPYQVVCIAQPPSLGTSETMMVCRAVWRIVAEAWSKKRQCIHYIA